MLTIRTAHSYPVSRTNVAATYGGSAVAYP
jgi:hypothetical protein